MNEQWERYLELSTKLITGQAAIDAERKRIDDFNESLRELIANLDGLGKLGRSLGNIGAVFFGLLKTDKDGKYTPDFTGVTGKVGSVLNILNQTKAGKEGFKLLGEKLDSIFGGTGSFTNTMKGILENAGIGLAIGGAVFGGKNAQIGGAIGSVLGEVAGKAIGKSLGEVGKVLGPLGAIAGGLLGGALGSLLSSTPRASATLSLDGVSTTGTSGKLKAAATSAGNSVLDALAQLAEQLGGELGGTISTSIGMRKGNYRVDTTGRGITKTSKGAIDFGEDAEAAVKFAVADAIRDGAITGLKAGTQALLRAGNDIEKQLDKALKFENVFKELKQRTDPIGFALGELAKEFEAMKKIFQEAGASAAEYADLEKLYLLKREDAIKQANSAALDLARDRRSLEIRIMELQGNAAAALAAARELEIEQMDATLRPLQRIIYQMEDLRAKADQFTQLATSLRNYRDTLFASDIANGTAYARARSKFLATSALAVSGNADAMGQLEGVSRDFLTQAKDNAGSFAQYQRDVAAVVNAVDKSIFAATETADYAQLQLDALSRSEVLLANIDSNIAAIAPALQTVEPLSPGMAFADNTASISALISEVQALRADNAAQAQAIAANNATMLRLWQRFDGDGLLIRTDADTPIQVESV